MRDVIARTTDRSEELQERWIKQTASGIPIPSSEEQAAIVARDSASILRQASTNPPWASIQFGAGPFLETSAGDVLLDLHGNNCHHIGYSHPRLLEELSDQMRSLSFVPRGVTNPILVTAAEKLQAAWPYGPSVVSFVPGGSAAVEVAIMVSRAHTGRYKTASFYGAYHGRSAGALSLGGRTQDRSPRLGPLLPGALHIRPFYPLPHEGAVDIESCAHRSLEDLTLCFEQEQEIAALFVEPIRNSPFVPPVWYWPEVKKLCSQYGTLFVCDEIPTGLGKTGKLFVTEHFNVHPDITLVGKALGGAVIPVAAMIASAELNSTSELNLGYFTYERSPMMGRAASVVLDIITTEKLVCRAAHLGKLAFGKMHEVTKSGLPIEEIRGAGLMLGVRARGDSKEKPETTARRIFAECLRRGLLLQYPIGARLMLSFPLRIDEALIENAIDIFATSVQAAVKASRS